MAVPEIVKENLDKAQKILDNASSMGLAEVAAHNSTLAQGYICLAATQYGIYQAEVVNNPVRTVGD